MQKAFQVNFGIYVSNKVIFTDAQHILNTTSEDKNFSHYHDSVVQKIQKWLYLGPSKASMPETPQNAAISFQWLASIQPL